MSEIKRVSYRYQAMLGQMRTSFGGEVVVNGKVNAELVEDWLRGRGVAVVTIEDYAPPSMPEVMAKLRNNLAEFKPITLNETEDRYIRR